MDARFTQQEIRLIGMTHRMLSAGSNAEEISSAIKRPMDFTQKLIAICISADEELDRRIQERKSEEC